MALTVPFTAVPLFTSSSSKKILYDPSAVSISPATLTVVPTGPLLGVIVAIVVGFAVACGRNDAMIVVMSSSVVKAMVILLLSKHFPHSKLSLTLAFYP